MTWRAPSHTWCMPPAMPGLAEGQLAAGRVEREVAAEGQVVVESTNSIPLPFSQNPASSRLISTVIV